MHRRGPPEWNRSDRRDDNSISSSRDFEGNSSFSRHNPAQSNQGWGRGAGRGDWRDRRPFDGPRGGPMGSGAPAPFLPPPLPGVNLRQQNWSNQPLRSRDFDNRSFGQQYGPDSSRTSRPPRIEQLDDFPRKRMTMISSFGTRPVHGIEQRQTSQEDNYSDNTDDDGMDESQSGYVGSPMGPPNSAGYGPSNSNLKPHSLSQSSQASRPAHLSRAHSPPLSPASRFGPAVGEGDRPPKHSHSDYPQDELNAKRFCPDPTQNPFTSGVGSTPAGISQSERWHPPEVVVKSEGYHGDRLPQGHAQQHQLHQSHPHQLHSSHVLQQPHGSSQPHHPPPHHLQHSAHHHQMLADFPPHHSSDIHPSTTAATTPSTTPTSATVAPVVITTVENAAAPGTANHMTKDMYLTEMNKKDSDMAAVQHQLSVCPERRIHLQYALQQAMRYQADGSQTAHVDEHGEESTQSKLSSNTEESFRTMLNRIVNANREKARMAHLLIGESPDSERKLAVCNDINDYPIVQQERDHDAKFRPFLQQQIQHWKVQDAMKQLQLTESYESHRKKWLSQTIAKETEFAADEEAVIIKDRRLQYFETLFPQEIRHAPPSPEGEQTDTYLNFKHRRSSQLAKTPAQLVGYGAVLSGHYIDKNGLIDDSMKLHQELEHINVWTEQEQEIFFNRFMVFPKKFWRIATYLPNKSCAECVRFYYRTKKHLQYKDRRNKTKKVTAKPKEHTKVTILEPVDESGTAWTTYERAQFQKALMMHGKNWSLMEFQLPGKTQQHIEEYYSRNRERFDKMLAADPTPHESATIGEHLLQDTRGGSHRIDFGVAPDDKDDETEPATAPTVASASSMDVVTSADAGEVPPTVNNGLAAQSVDATVSSTAIEADNAVLPVSQPQLLREHEQPQAQHEQPHQQAAPPQHQQEQPQEASDVSKPVPHDSAQSQVANERDAVAQAVSSESAQAPESMLVISASATVVPPEPLPAEATQPKPTNITPVQVSIQPEPTPYQSSSIPNASAGVIETATVHVFESEDVPMDTSED